MEVFHSSERSQEKAADAREPFVSHFRVSYDGRKPRKALHNAFQLLPSEYLKRALNEVSAWTYVRVSSQGKKCCLRIDLAGFSLFSALCDSGEGGRSVAVYATEVVAVELRALTASGSYGQDRTVFPPSGFLLNGSNSGLQQVRFAKCRSFVGDMVSL